MISTKAKFDTQVAGYQTKKRRRRLWLRIVSALACVVVFCTTYALILPAITMERQNTDASVRLAPAASYSVSLHEDPSDVGTKRIDLPQDAHVRLVADGSADAWQWQIWSEETGSWLDIYGDNDQSCDLYYAKLKNVLSGDSALVRAAATVDGEEWLSDTASVSVQALQQPVEAEEPVILDEGSLSPEGAYLGSGPVEPAAFSLYVKDADEDLPKTGEEEADAPDPVPGPARTYDSGEAVSVPVRAYSSGEEDLDGEEEEILDEEEEEVLDGEDDETFDNEDDETFDNEEEEDPVFSLPVNDGSGEFTGGGGVMSVDDEPEDGGESDNEETGFPDQTRYEVRVRYQYEGGAAATDPWWATFSATGATGNYQVNFPTIQGYKVKSVTADDSSVTPILVHASDGTITGLILPEYVQADLNYTVIYEPDTVSYTVHHWLQNLDDPTKYTMQENDTETKFNLTGTLLRGDAKTYEGFSQVAYMYPTLAGDGSTVVDIYYDRSYYKIDFELNGGEGVNGIYAQYGADLTQLAGDSMTTPTKVGYKFTGWYLDEDCTQEFTGSFPTKMPAKNSVYYAGWEIAGTNYSVIVWIENLTGDGYDSLCTFDLSANTDDIVGYDTDAVAARLEQIATDSTDPLYQKDLQYFTLNKEKSQTNRTVYGDGSGSVNVYYTRNSYTLRFVYARSRNGTYQMSTSNNGYSMHTDYGPPYDIANGCNWVDLSGAPSISTDYQATINANKDVLTTGTFTYASSSGSNTNSYTYYYIDLTAKYGANIHDYWPQAGCVTGPYTSGREKYTYSLISWGTEYESNFRDKAGTGEPNISPYYEVMDDLLVYDAAKTADTGPAHTFTSYTHSNTLYYWTYNFYYEALEAEKDNSNGVTINRKTYIPGDSITVTTTQENHGADYQAVPNQEGFRTPTAGDGTVKLGSNSGSGTAASPFVLNLYYTRERYSITFHNGYWGSKVVENIPYGESLAGYERTATVQYNYTDDQGKEHIETLDPEMFELQKAEPLPANRIDPDFEAKYAFGGTWHTSWSASGHTGVGDVFDLTTATMPQHDLILYPEWVPRTYTATFYWQNVENAVLKDAEGNTVTGAVTDVNGKPITQTYEYGGKLYYFPVEYGQYEFLHWSYFRYTQDCEDKDEDGNVIATYKAGTNLYVPDGLEGNEKAYQEFYDFVTKQMQEGNLQEVRLDFDTATFTSNTAVFGTWNKTVYLDYTVHYVLLDVDPDKPGEIQDLEVAYFDDDVAYNAAGQKIGVKIADDLEDSRFAGVNITLTAKVGDDLYPAYAKPDENGLACYPIGSSTHNLTMDITADKLEYTFLYKKGNPVTYRVEYRTPKLYENGEPVKDDDGNVVYEELLPTMDFNSTQAIITEDAPAVVGYTLMADPDTGQREYQVTRTLSYADLEVDENGDLVTDEDGNTRSVITPENTITFYYVKDETAQMYTVEHYIQQMDGSYDLYNDMTFPGIIGETYTAAPLLIPGWWCDLSVEGTNEQEKLTGEGLTLKLYYSAYPVEITKIWAANVPEADRKAVQMWVYRVLQESDDNDVVEKFSDDNMSAVTLNSDHDWQTTVYLPYLEYLNEETGEIEPLDGFYLVVEEDASNEGYWAAYSDSTEVLIDGVLTKGSKVTLEKPVTGEDGNPSVKTVQVTVTNSFAVELPATGGSGTLPYAMGGTLLTAASLLYGYLLRRKRERRSAR